MPRINKTSDIKAYRKEYYIANREKEIARTRKHREQKRDMINFKNLTRNISHERQIKRNAMLIIKSRKNKANVIRALGGICSCCGETKMEFLQIDHINGGGTRERKEVDGGHVEAMRRRITMEGYPRNKYRVLCSNCNSSLGFYGYCPHSAIVSFLENTDSRHS